MRDYKYWQAVGWRQHFLKVIPQNPKLKEVADAYTSNIERLFTLLMLPTQLAVRHAAMQREWDRHEVKMKGELDKDLSAEEIKSLTEKSSNQLNNTPVEEFVKHALLLIPVMNELINRDDPQLSPAIEGMLYYEIVAAWTSFEAMAGDLWEVAVNAHPSVLSNLSGNPKRIAKARTKTPASAANIEAGISSTEGKKKVDLDDIQRVARGDFNLNDKMGTLLKERCDFTSLGGLREAYSVAFSKNSQGIDVILSDESLDTLASMRHLIVHKAGCADREYFDSMARLPLLPKLALGEDFKPDGLTVVNLVGPAIIAGNNLLTEIDKWIINN